MTTAALTVKNVMECMRALELDGRVETIKPLSMGHFDLGGDDEPGPSKRRKVDGDGSGSEDDVRKEKERQKAKEKAKEKKRKAREKEKKEKKKKEKEKKRKKKEKEKEKERERKKKRKKEERVCLRLFVSNHVDNMLTVGQKKKPADSDDEAGNDSDALVALDDSPVKKRKRSLSVSSVSSASSSSDSDSDSDASSASGSDSDVSSVDSDDIDDVDADFSRPVDSLPAMMSNPFDLSDTQVVYRATRRLDESVLLGQMQTPCGRCPQFTFCEESGPVNASGCKYYDDWLIDKEGGGGWDRGGALEKMRPGLKEDEEEPVAPVAAETNGHAEVNGEEGVDGEYGAEVDGDQGEYAEGDQEAPIYD